MHYIGTFHDNNKDYFQIHKLPKELILLIVKDIKPIQALVIHAPHENFDNVFRLAMSKFFTDLVILLG